MGGGGSGATLLHPRTHIGLTLRGWRLRGLLHHEARQRRWLALGRRLHVESVAEVEACTDPVALCVFVSWAGGVGRSLRSPLQALPRAGHLAPLHDALVAMRVQGNSAREEGGGGRSAGAPRSGRSVAAGMVPDPHTHGCRLPQAHAVLQRTGCRRTRALCSCRRQRPHQHQHRRRRRRGGRACGARAAGGVW
jgi:hypothetical protein